MREQIVGRVQELAAVDRFLDALQGGPALLVLDGEAGIGKSLLRGAAHEIARERGYRVLECGPVEIEATMAYVGLHDLLQEVDQGVLRSLPEPQRRAIEICLHQAAPTDAPVEPAAVAIGSLAILRQAAAREPVLLSIDDWQWLDPSTAAVLKFVLRRLTDERIGALVVRRGNGASPSSDAVPQLASGAWTELVPVGSLSLGALHRAIQTHLDVSLPRPALVRLHEVTRGNPYFGIELVRAFGPRGASRIQPGVPVPEALRDGAERRLKALPRRTRRFVEAVAVLGRPTEEMLAEVLPDVSSISAEVARAERAQLIERSGGRVRIAHPLFASLIVHSIAARERRQLNSRLAAMRSEPFERARSLAITADGPDEGIAAALESAATDSAARGASIESADLRELAVALTPPSDAGILLRRRLALADAAFTAGDTQRARSELEALIPELDEREARLAALLLLATIRWHDDESEAAVELAEGALREAGDDVAWRARIHARLGWMLDFDLQRQAAHTSAALLALDAEAEPVTYAFALLNDAWVRLLSGQEADDEAVERGEQLQELASSWDFSTIPANWAKAMDRSDVARKRLHRYLDRARDTGDESSVAPLLAYLAELETWAGNVDRAEELAEEALGAAQQTDQSVYVALSLARRALVRAYRGDLAAALEDAQQSLELARPPLLPPAALGVIGFVKLTQADLAACDRALSTAAEMLDGIGMREPAAYRFHADLIEAVVGLGDLSRAAGLLARFEERGRTVPRPWVLATGARCRAMLRAAHGDVVGALAALDDALAAHRDLQMPLELGRTLLTQGIVLRRAGRRRLARDTIEQAIEVFDGLGCTPWADRARAEEARLGLRPTVDQALTPSEERVARMAASGMPNRAIAMRLSISPKTVEANLARAYSKLGIHSRAELGAVMARTDQRTA